MTEPVEIEDESNDESNLDDESNSDTEKDQKVKLSSGRPRKIFTDAELRSIGVMAGYGMPIAHISAILGVCESTLYRNKKLVPVVGEAYNRGAARARLSIAKTLFEKATVEREISALIWWEKSRYGMCERREEPQQVNVDRPQNVSIYIPENNRDSG